MDGDVSTEKHGDGLVASKKIEELIKPVITEMTFQGKDAQGRHRYTWEGG